MAEFGKRRVSPAAEPGGSGGRGDGQNAGLPWSNRPDSAACNIGFGNLMHTLRAATAVDGRIHAETLLCASGLAAGFAAQSALLFRVRTKGSAERTDLKIVQPFRDGPRYLFGDPLNETLATAFGFSRGGALAAGATQKQLPPVEPSFQHVARMISQQRDQFSVGSEHQPQIRPERLLVSMWPHCCKALTSIPLHGDFSAPNWRQAWPLITAYAVGCIIGEVNAVLSVSVSLTLAFEATLYGSKLDPILVGESGLPQAF
jgi:hypothetical protein